MLCENLTSARATLSSLCVCQIALVVAQGELRYRSRNPLCTLYVSDHSRSGAVLILAA